MKKRKNKNSVVNCEINVNGMLFLKECGVYHFANSFFLPPAIKLRQKKNKLSVKFLQK